MASKTFLLLALALATVLLITSEMAAARDLASNEDSELDNAKYGRDDRGYYNGGHGGYNNGGGHGRGRGRCRYGCCGRGGYYNGGCRCCSTFAEATAYKQAQEVQTHN